MIGTAGPLWVAEGTDFDPPAGVDAPTDVLPGCEADGVAEVGFEEDADEEEVVESAVAELLVAADPGAPVAVGLCWGDAAVSADPPLVHMIVPVVTNATAATAEPMAAVVAERLRRPARCPLSRMS